MVTIKEIARKAKVSYATVSRALTGKSGVGEKTRKRILKIADRMGYTPDLQARALVTGKVPFLGLVVPDIANPFYPELILGAEKEVFRRGYNLLLLNTDWKVKRLRQALELLKNRRVAGLVTAAPVSGVKEELNGRWPHLVRSLVLAGVAAPRGMELNSVEVDDRLGGKLVGEHLLGLGWKRIAFVSGPRGERATRHRLSGLKQALKEAGASDRLAAASHGKWTVQSGYEQTRALLTGRGRPDAFFAANDMLAVGVVEALRARGLSVGRDAAVVGYDDIGFARYLDVPLTSVAQPKEELGRSAAACLIDLTEGTRSEYEPTALLEPRLVLRRSCGFSGEMERKG